MAAAVVQSSGRNEVGTAPRFLHQRRGPCGQTPLAHFAARCCCRGHRGWPAAVRATESAPSDRRMGPPTEAATRAAAPSGRSAPACVKPFPSADTAPRGPWPTVPVAHMVDLEPEMTQSPAPRPRLRSKLYSVPLALRGLWRAAESLEALGFRLNSLRPCSNFRACCGATLLHHCRHGSGFLSGWLQGLRASSQRPQDAARRGCKSASGSRGAEDRWQRRSRRRAPGAERTPVARRFRALTDGGRRSAASLHPGGLPAGLPSSPAANVRATGPPGPIEGVRRGEARVFGFGSQGARLAGRGHHRQSPRRPGR